MSAFAEQVREFWIAFRDNELSAIKSRVALREREKVMRPDAEHWQLMMKCDPYKTREAVRKMAENVVALLCREGEQAFKAPGARLDIPEAPLRDKHIPGDEGERLAFLEAGISEQIELLDGYLAGFDPCAVWAGIEAEYGGDKGKEEAYRQTAQALLSELDLNPGQPVEFKSGHLFAGIHVALSDYSHNKNELAWGSDGNVVRLHLALASFATWAEFHIMAAQLRQSAYAWRNRKVQSREKFRYGNENYVELVTYKNRFEYRFPMSVAEQLQVFIASYAPAAAKAS
jgi:hypothetical protein